MSQCSQGRTDSSREESKYIGASAAATETENHGGHGQLRKMASPGDEHPQFGCGTQPHVGPVLRQTLLAQIEASAPFENAASGSGGGCHRRKNSPTYLVWTMLRTELHEKGSGENQANPPPLLLKSPLSCLARFGRRNARTMSSMLMFFLHCIIISLVGIHNEYAAGSCHAVTLLTLVVLPSSNYQNGLTIIIHSARVAQLCSISSSYGYYY